MKKVVYHLIIITTILLSTGCGGGGGDVSDENYGWVTITSHDGPTYTTFDMTIRLSGSAYINGALDDMFNFDTGVQVYWKNLTSGIGGSANQYSDYGCDWFVCTWDYHKWYAYIPLVLGENQIEVTASDINGNWGKETITVIHPLTHAPGIFSVQAQYLTPGSLSFEAEVDTGDLPSEIRFEFYIDSSLMTFETTTAEFFSTSHDRQLIQVPYSGAFDPNTKYYYRGVASNSAGTTTTRTYSFTTGYFQPYPSITIEQPDPIGAEKTTLHGSVNPNGVSADTWYEWGADPSLTVFTNSPVVILGPISAPSPVDFTLSGLSSNTTYYFRLAASNTTGTRKSGIYSFTTTQLLAPQTQTAPATSLWLGEVQLNGIINPNGLEADGWFEFGTDPSLSTHSSTPSIPMGFSVENRNISHNLTGLSDMTTYYFRVVSANAMGTASGSTLSFTTPARLSVTTEPATPIEYSAATLRGTANPNGYSTHLAFEWGMDPSLTKSLYTYSMFSGARTAVLPFSATLSSLSDSTTYYYRARGSNSYEIKEGEIMAFTTIPQNSSFWGKTYGHLKSGMVNDYEILYSMTRTADGGIAVAGDRKVSNVSNGLWDLWIVRLDPHGRVQWSKGYDLGENEVGPTIISTSDRGFLVTANILWSTSWWMESIVLKLNESGLVEWSKGFNFVSIDSAIQTKDNGFLLAANKSLIKLGADGSIQWHNTDYGRIYDVQETNAGEFIAVGTTAPYGTVTADFLISKTDGSGNIIWQKAWGGAGADMAETVELTSDGGFIVVGSTHSFGAGGGDIWVLKFGPDETLEWEVAYGDISDDRVDAIKQSSDGGFVLGGVMGYDLLAFKLNPDGIIQWQKNFGGSINRNYPKLVELASDGGYFLGTSFYNSLFALDLGMDFLILKLNPDGTCPPLDEDAPMISTSTASLSTEFSTHPVPSTNKAGDINLSIVKTHPFTFQLAP